MDFQLFSYSLLPSLVPSIFFQHIYHHYIIITSFIFCTSSHSIQPFHTPHTHTHSFHIVSHIHCFCSSHTHHSSHFSHISHTMWGCSSLSNCTHFHTHIPTTHQHFTLHIFPPGKAGSIIIFPHSSHGHSQALGLVQAIFSLGTTSTGASATTLHQLHIIFKVSLQFSPNIHSHTQGCHPSLGFQKTQIPKHWPQLVHFPQFNLRLFSSQTNFSGGVWGPGFPFIYFHSFQTPQLLPPRTLILRRHFQKFSP